MSTTEPERATEMEIRPLKRQSLAGPLTIHQLQVDRPDSIQALLLTGKELERLRCLLDMYNEDEPEQDRFTDDAGYATPEGSPS